MKKRKKCLVTFKRNIHLHKDELWTPSNDIEYDDIHTDAWFDIKYHKTEKELQPFSTSIAFEKNTDTHYIKCYKVELILNEVQKTILNRWFNCCIMMYNETIKYILSRRKPELISAYDEELESIQIQRQNIKLCVAACKKQLKVCNIEEHLLLEVKIKQYEKEDDELKTKIRELNIKYQINPDYQIIRTYGLKEVRNNIILSSKYKSKDGTYKYPIPTHILDCAIKHACANFKSALSNVRNKHQTHFRIRKMKFSKPTKVMEIEPSYFHYKDKQKNNLLTVLYTSLGNVKYKLNNKTYSDLRQIKYVDNENKEQLLFDDIQSACNLQFSKLQNTYLLYIPKIKEIKIVNNPNQIVSIDLGERTFACCLSESEVIKIGNNTKPKLEGLLTKIDELQKKDIIKKKKRKREKRYRKKIKNLVEDLHWKTISFITKNYKSVLVGNISTKDIINKQTSVLKKRDKRIMQALSFYKFRQRLDYKCKSKGIKCKVVNESYTSKTCSRCGCIKDKLGGVKTYVCNHCHAIIDRDVNGSRGIYISAY